MISSTTLLSPSSPPLLPNPNSSSRISPSTLPSPLSNSIKTNHLHQFHGGGISCKPIPTTAVRCAATPGTEQQKHNRYDLKTLTVWLLEQEQAGAIDPEMTIVLSSISMACKHISSLLKRANISKLTGNQGTVNVQGEKQKKLDVIANEVFCNILRSSGKTGIIASEEEEVPVVVEENYSGKYIVVFDPLDGSDNVDSCLSTGSIFGVHRREFTTLDQSSEKCVVEVCQPGKNLLAAGYCIYSSSVIFVLTVGNGVYMFTLDPLYGEFVLTKAGVKIPSSGSIYAFNEGNYQLWDEKLKSYVDRLKDEMIIGKRYSSRYIGSVAVEVHRTMLYGGIYGNPKNEVNKNGKLRLLYEIAPLSFIMEQAGGMGTDGQQRILDIQPMEVHQRVPIFFGSINDMKELEKMLA